MRKVRFFLSFAAVVVLLFVLIHSCIAPDEVKEVYEEDAPDGKLKLRFISSWGGVDSKAGTLQEVLNKFMKDNKDIEVVNESLFGDDFLPKLKADFASGNDPDVFGLWPGSDIKLLIKSNKVADLTDVLDSDKKWKKSFGEDMWDYTTFDNKIYGLPVEIIFECLFINKDLFDKYSVKVPETYEELKKAVTVFKRNGIIPIAYNSFAEGTYLYQNIVAMIGGKENVENPFKDGKVNDCYIDAMYYVKELYELGAFPQNSFTMTSSERNNLFKDKKAAMIVQGSWFIGDFRDNVETVDIVPFPHIKEGKSPPTTLIYGLGCGTFYMSKNAWDNIKKRDASIRLLKTLTSSETAAVFAQQTGMLSNVDISGYKVRYNRLTKKGQYLLNNAQSLIGPPDSFVYRSAWEEVIVKDFPYFLEGEKKAEDIWNKAIERGIIFN